MSEQEKAKSSYMQELDAWSDANVIFPLLNLDQTEQDWEEVADLVKKAIRAKNLESYRNGQAAGPRRFTPALRRAAPVRPA